MIKLFLKYRVMRLTFKLCIILYYTAISINYFLFYYTLYNFQKLFYKFLINNNFFVNMWILIHVKRYIHYCMTFNKISIHFNILSLYSTVALILFFLLSCFMFISTWLYALHCSRYINFYIFF